MMCTNIVFPFLIPSEIWLWISFWLTSLHYKQTLVRKLFCFLLYNRFQIYFLFVYLFICCCFCLRRAGSPLARCLYWMNTVHGMESVVVTATCVIWMTCWIELKPVSWSILPCYITALPSAPHMFMVTGRVARRCCCCCCCCCCCWWWWWWWGDVYMIKIIWVHCG